MNSLYNLGINTYRMLVKAASVHNAKASKMLEGQRRTIDKIVRARHDKAPKGFDLWVHVASLGEFEQARPMIEAIKRQIPDYTILLSFFSPSGYEVRHNYDKVDCVVYLPFDTRCNARDFIEAACPHKVVFVKYEFWGNYLSELKRLNIPTYLISGIFRPSQSFFKPWGGMMRKMLSTFTHIYVQDEASRGLLAGIGYDNVTVAGDTRFDRVTDVMRNTFEVPSLKNWTQKTSLTLIAGSSWPADEQIYIPWLKDHPKIHAIIAPHEFDGNRLAELRARLGSNAILWSQCKDLDTIPEGVTYIIIDCFGLLSSIYRYGDIALIGGGFGAGIHNLNEAAVYGLPVLFGPNHKKFREAYGLIDCGGGFIYDNADTFNHHISALVSDTSALQQASIRASSYIKANIGATKIILHDIFSIDE